MIPSPASPCDERVLSSWDLALLDLASRRRPLSRRWGRCRRSWGANVAWGHLFNDGSRGYLARQSVVRKEKSPCSGAEGEDVGRDERIRWFDVGTIHALEVVNMVETLHHPSFRHEHGRGDVG